MPTLEILRNIPRRSPLSVCPYQYHLWDYQRPQHQLDSPPDRPEVPFTSRGDIRMYCDPCTDKQRCHTAPNDIEASSHLVGLYNCRTWLKWIPRVDNVVEDDGYRSAIALEKGEDSEREEEHAGKRER